LNAALIAAGTLLASASIAETQTYSTITDSGGFYHRKSTRVTSATTIATENVGNTKANLSVILSSNHRGHHYDRADAEGRYGYQQHQRGAKRHHCYRDLHWPGEFPEVQSQPHDHCKRSAGC
jgi:hypothetical protein